MDEIDTCITEIPETSLQKVCNDFTTLATGL